MANDNRKNQNQSKPDQRDGMRDPSQKQEQGGNQQVNRDQDNKDRGKLGEQEGMDRQQQSGQGQQKNPDPSNNAPGNENEIEGDDELGDDDVEDEDETRITQRNPSQRDGRDPSSAK